MLREQGAKIQQGMEIEQGNRAHAPLPSSLYLRLSFSLPASSFLFLCAADKRRLRKHSPLAHSLGHTHSLTQTDRQEATER